MSTQPEKVSEHNDELLPLDHQTTDGSEVEIYENPNNTTTESVSLQSFARFPGVRTKSPPQARVIATKVNPSIHGTGGTSNPKIAVINRGAANDRFDDENFFTNNPSATSRYKSDSSSFQNNRLPPNGLNGSKSHESNFSNVKQTVRSKNKFDDDISLERRRRGCSYVCWLAVCATILIVVLVILLVFRQGAVPRLGTLDGTRSPTTRPTRTPTASPTTPAPTSSPTKNPTSQPTKSPTTTLEFASQICDGSTQVSRTSICIDEERWVRCERDGTVKIFDGEFIRSCEVGDVCACEPFERTSATDPCVLIRDKEDSEVTCRTDRFY